MADDGSNGIGPRIARARQEAGLTQRELAAFVGITPRSLQNYEAGRIVPHRHLQKLAAGCRCTAGWLLYGKPSELATPRESLTLLRAELNDRFEALERELNALAANMEHMRELRAQRPKIKQGDGSD
jgi:transcriptional regulator with XRE-family HTH domain